MAASISGLQRRLAREQAGFTLIELLVVLVIIGILLAVAVPSYLGFRERASRRAAESNVRSAVPAVEAYYTGNATYAGMTDAALVAIDGGIKATVVGTPGASYCITNTQGGFSYMKNGPAAPIVEGDCT
jgi:type IV pilus assembly protein PilA